MLDPKSKRNKETSKGSRQELVNPCPVDWPYLGLFSTLKADYKAVN